MWKQRCAVKPQFLIEFLSILRRRLSFLVGELPQFLKEGEGRDNFFFHTPWSRCVKIKNHPNICNLEPNKFRPLHPVTHPCLPHVFFSFLHHRVCRKQRSWLCQIQSSLWDNILFHNFSFNPTNFRPVVKDFTPKQNNRQSVLLLDGWHISLWRHLYNSLRTHKKQYEDTHVAV